VTSYAVTVRDIHGKGIELPPPPKSADGERDFECPYCYIICPARYGSGRPWRTHLLQDLQPYVCTYQHCEASEQLFRSRREWAEHEATHRKAWRCPEHLTAVYGSRAGLEDHLRQEHADTIPVSQLDAIINIGETSTVDVREKCPICLASADTKGMGDFQSHVANHLERFATFALPNGNEEDTDGASSAASRGRSGSSESQDVREMSLPGDDSDYGEGVDEPIVQDDQAVLSADSLRSLPDVSGDRLTTLLAQPHLEDQDEIEKPASQTPDSYIERTGAFKAYLVSLGAESVRFFRRYDWWRGDATFQDENIAAKALGSFDRDRFPNMKIRQGTNGFKNRLKFNGPNPGNADLQAPTRQSTNTQYETDEESEASTTYAQEETENKAPVLSLFEIPTLHDLYRSRKLLQRDQSFAPNDSYNRIISFCYHDLTRLKVDAIVNSANADLGKSKMATTLNNAIHEAAGPGLAEEVKFRGRIKPGETALTGGYLLPSAHIIHAARPTFQGAQHMTRLNTLTSCYHSALELALEQGFKSVAFPCIGTGGCGFPSRVAARIVLQETREFLDKHPDHPFERIVFAMNSALDDKAYMDFFPVSLTSKKYYSSPDSNRCFFPQRMEIWRLRGHRCGLQIVLRSLLKSLRLGLRCRSLLMNFRWNSLHMYPTFQTRYFVSFAG
jgi:O-acetyl-ADP-ribose deacetylase (regulator of RNase III)